MRRCSCPFPTRTSFVTVVSTRKLRPSNVPLCSDSVETTHYIKSWRVWILPETSRCNWRNPSLFSCKLRATFAKHIMRTSSRLVPMLTYLAPLTHWTMRLVESTTIRPLAPYFTSLEKHHKNQRLKIPLNRREIHGKWAFVSHRPTHRRILYCRIFYNRCSQAIGPPKNDDVTARGLSLCCQIM